MEKEEILAVFSETPLASSIEALLSGNFTEAPSEPVGKDELVIGELSPFEMALLTSKDRIANDHNALVDGEGMDMATIQKNKRTYEAIDTLLWASIRERLGEHTTKGIGIGIREGYKIVQINGNGRVGKDLLSAILGEDPLAALLSGMGKGAHDCEHCPAYEKCDLPIKIPRA